MSNETKQTAVEWLIQKLINKQNGVFDGFPYLSVDEIYDQAKEMHKKEMVMFVLNVMGKYRNGDVLAEVATELYEKTYGGGEQ